MNKILIVDDDPDILEFLSYNLKKEGHLIQTAKNGRDAIEKGVEFKPDLVILDVMMPVMDGMEACQMMRGMPEFKSTVITFLTARGEDYSQIAGYDAGADDYILKPIKPRLLVSKVNSLLRRNIEAKPNTLANSQDEKNIVIDNDKFLVHFRGESYYLPKKQFQLLSLLSSKPGKVFTRDEIYSLVWGNQTIVGDRTIDVHIRKIRSAIGEDLIKTIKGVGYKYEDANE